MDGTSLKHHFSHIVSASATKSGSEVELIDPFQLTNWRNKTPLDHLYPKFKLFLEKFKYGEFTNIAQTTSPGINEDHDVQMLPAHELHDVQMLPEHENQDDETGEQRLQAAKQKESPTGLDMVLQKLMDPAVAPEPINIPESLNH